MFDGNSTNEIESVHAWGTENDESLDLPIKSASLPMHFNNK